MKMQNSRARGPISGPKKNEAGDLHVLGYHLIESTILKQSMIQFNRMYHALYLMLSYRRNQLIST